MTGTSGPLSGVRVVELGGIGAVPFAAMQLADLGADVVTTTRRDAVDTETLQRKGGIVLNRGKHIIGLDLKDDRGRAVAERLISSSDVVLEGFRPGVAERLGLGPDDFESHTALVYGRLTGWGRRGVGAGLGGHDINYLAQSGILGMLGSEGHPPVPPLNLLGDYAGGAMLLVQGVLAALLHRSRTGRGQVVEANMTHGAALLGSVFAGLRATGEWDRVRGANRLDGGAPYYQVYECSDGRHLAVGAAEDQFFDELARALDLDDETRQLCRGGPDGWPRGRKALSAIFARRTRDEWTSVLGGLDCCVTPVLSPAEAIEHDENRRNGVFAEVDGVVQPTAAPGFLGTPVITPRLDPHPTESGLAALERAGFSGDETRSLVDDGIVSFPEPRGARRP